MHTASGSRQQGGKAAVLYGPWWQTEFVLLDGVDSVCPRRLMNSKMRGQDAIDRTRAARRDIINLTISAKG
jgi:hypothetical protein